jgi:pimeloyl-ACP methyl ester carboxylesterase
LFKTAVFALFLSCPLWAQTTVQFSADPSDVPTGAFAVGPFPSNALTVSDHTSLATGVRVNLPPLEASCGLQSGAVCSNNGALNKLDGFSINPRLMVCFSSDVDPATLPAGIGLVSLPGGAPISITQVIFDPASKCAFAKPANVLNQASKYLLLVGSAVHDVAGSPVVASPAFSSCMGGLTDSYCTALTAALAGRTPPGGGPVVSASLFTTMAATAWLEAARRFVDTQLPMVVPAGVPTTFQISKLSRLTWVPDRGGIPPQDIPLSALSNVDSVSFGLFLSPNYLDVANISRAPNAPISYSSVSYHVFTPSVKKSAKIPVVIYGHGMGDNQFGGPTYIASTLAKNGFATLALELPGHGYGPAGVVNLTGTNGKISTVLTPGRGTPSPYSSTIGPTDGCISLGPVGIRDCGRQGALDMAALVHAIIATNGLNLNLDPSRIYYVGQSFGSTIGTLFSAVEPAVTAAVLNGDGGTSSDIARLAITGRSLGAMFLQSVGDPALWNVAAGMAQPEEYFHDVFNDNYVFRNDPPRVNGIGGAIQVQAAFAAADWMGMPGDPLAFAPHLKNAPLSGVPAKRILFQFGYGDLEVPNATESAVVRAAGAESTTSYLHFEAAAAAHPSLLTVQDPSTPMLPILPHRVLSNPTIFTPGNEAELSLALAEQQQTSDFFSSNGSSITDSNKYLSAPFSPSDRVFQTPANSLPDALNFLQIPK